MKKERASLPQAKQFVFYSCKWEEVGARSRAPVPARAASERNAGTHRATIVNNNNSTTQTSCCCCAARAGRSLAPTTDSTRWSHRHDPLAALRDWDGGQWQAAETSQQRGDNQHGATTMAVIRPDRDRLWRSIPTSTAVLQAQQCYKHNGNHPTRWCPRAGGASADAGSRREGRRRTARRK